MFHSNAVRFRRRSALTASMAALGLGGRSVEEAHDVEEVELGLARVGFRVGLHDPLGVLVARQRREEVTFPDVAVKGVEKGAEQGEGPQPTPFHRTAKDADRKDVPLSCSSRQADIKADESKTWKASQPRAAPHGASAWLREKLRASRPARSRAPKG